ncbi:hypothetical protein [Oryzobacter terrae]|uniref:hypothetical protein n=1 Tax=Oryzobacter terrae TaxID=1620385 RepID=UPI00366CE7DB
MTRIRVDAAEVAELGVALAETGAHLCLLGDPGAERWALGPGETGPAVEELLGGWRRVRLSLAEALAELGGAAAGAGALYLETEGGVGRSLRGGTW